MLAHNRALLSARARQEREGEADRRRPLHRAGSKTTVITGEESNNARSRECMRKARAHARIYVRRRTVFLSRGGEYYYGNKILKCNREINDSAERRGGAVRREDLISRRCAGPKGTRACVRALPRFARVENRCAGCVSERLLRGKGQVGRADAA